MASVGEDVQNREPSCTAQGNVKWCSWLGKNLVVPQNVKPRTLLYDPLD